MGEMMSILLQKVEKIEGMLEQVNDLTCNQSTVLVASEEGIDIDEVLDEMSEYKEILIKQVEQLEIDFENTYKQYRENLTNKEEVEKLKTHISKILDIKKMIIENERKNMLLFQSRERQEREKLIISPTPKSVVEIYKRNNIKK